MQMTPQQSRDKRRFYVKKIAIGLDRFKEWEEQLGDQWYRHHNKVNNIVYYHCKHEPCYASMKAKILIDFVQLYVTEEGHAHPPFTNSVTNLGDWALPSSSSEFVSIDCKPQINSALSKGCGTSQSSKRQRTADEDYSSKKIPLLCQQQLLQLFSMQGDPIHETMMTENHQLYNGDFPIDEGFDMAKDPKNAQMQNDAEGASTSFAVGEQVEGLCYEEGVTTNNPDTAKNPKPTGNDCAQKANNSSDKSERLKNEKNKQNSGPIRGDTNLQNSSGSETKDSDNDDDSMDSEQVTTEDSSSPANSPSSKLEQNNNVSTNDNDEIFSMIRARVESKPKRKRLQYIRKLKRQLNYFIEMQEVRELSARLPDNVKFNDIFHN